MSNLPMRLPEPNSILQLLETLDDVPLELRGELDRRTISFLELTELGIGNIIALNRPAGENVDLYAGRVLIGSGEVLAMDGILMLRVADLLDRPARSASVGPVDGESADAGDLR